MVKRRLIYAMLIVGLLTGCSVNNNDQANSENNNTAIEEYIEENIEEETTVYTVFNALGKNYESSKNIYEVNEGDKIYDQMNEYPHVYGEYKEIDFASDLLTEYLHKNPDAYNYIVSNWDSSSEEVELIADEEKERVMENANFLGEQFGLSNEDPVYFKLDKVILQSKNEEEGIVELELRGYLSATDGNYRPLGTFTITVYTKDDKLYGSIV